MNILLVGVVIYFVVLVLVLLLQRIAGRYTHIQQAQPGKEDPTGAGFAPNAAWGELDTYIIRSQGSHPLQ